MTRLGFISFVTLACVLHVYGHSWIACTDYLEMSGGTWDQNKCRAFPRHGWKYTQKGSFGLDRGYDYFQPKNNKACKTKRDDADAYDVDYPMAVYYPGQTVVIAHPTKNHVADVGCTNKYIPDNGSKVYISKKDVKRDPKLSQFKSGTVIDLGKSLAVGWEVEDSATRKYPKAGFQNAPKFCDNPDKALATNNFTIPNLEPGRYTFLWGWWFNSKDDSNLYTSCWEADVRSKQERNNILASRGQNTADPVDYFTGASVGAGQNQGQQGQNQGQQGQNQGQNQGQQGQNQGQQGQNQGQQGQNQGQQGQNQGQQGQNQGQQGQGNQIPMPGPNGMMMECNCMCKPAAP